MRGEAPRLAYRAELDGLRGVAVAGVVVFHLWPSLLPGGFLGVDAFFVLSGFLITSLLLTEHAQSGSIRLTAFWARRARRLLPALFVLLGVVAVVAAVWWPAEDLERIRGDGLAGLGYVANWRFLLEGDQYFDLVRGPSPLRHLWSLAIEEQAYLVWPLVVAFAVRRGGVRAVRIVALVGAGLSAVALAVAGSSGDLAHAYYGTDTRIHALLLGAALATARSLPARLPRWISPAALAAVLVLWATAGESEGWLFVWGLPVHAALVALALAGAPVAPRLSELLSTRPLVVLGKVSYGLYLWHWPVVVFVAPPRVDLDGIALAAVRLALTAVLTVASYRLVERPVRRGALRGRVGAVAVPLATVLSAGVVVVAASGARPVPAYLDLAAPDATIPVVATTPAAAPTHRSSAAPPTAAAAAPVDPPGRVLLVGDSVAFTLQDELGAELSARGVSFTAATAIGCGAAAGVDPSLAVVATESGAPTEWSSACAESVTAIQTQGLATGPDLVVFASTWETSDRIVDGRLVPFDTAEWDAIVRAEVEAAVTRLSSSGARVALLTAAPAVDGELRQVPEGENDRRRRYNHILRDVAGDLPERTVLVDLAGLVCDGQNPCPPEVDGVVVRPLDGIHFEDAGAVLVAGRLAEALTAIDVGQA